jgi:hypothetical protein
LGDEAIARMGNPVHKHHMSDGTKGCCDAIDSTIKALMVLFSHQGCLVDMMDNLSSCMINSPICSREKKARE